MSMLNFYYLNIKINHEVNELLSYMNYLFEGEKLKSNIVNKDSTLDQIIHRF